MSNLWECPDCGRRFGRAGQGHDCAPAMDLEEYFATGPVFERAIFEVIRDHMRTLDPDIWFEPVSVGIFFKRRSRFLSLRTMTRWIAVSFSLNRLLVSGRIPRKVIAHGSRFFHVVNVRSADEIDEELLAWLNDAWEDDSAQR